MYVYISIYDIKHRASKHMQISPANPILLLYTYIYITIYIETPKLRPGFKMLEFIHNLGSPSQVVGGMKGLKKDCIMLRIDHKCY